MPTENQSNPVAAPRPGMEFWDKLNALPRYAFLLSPSGKSVQKFEDQAMGNWIDVHEAQKVVDQAQEQLSELRDELGAVKGEYGRLANKVDALQRRLSVAPAMHPFVEKVVRKLERFQECADDGQGADIGRHWFDLLTQLGLLNRVQRSPALWEMTQQGEDALELSRQSAKSR